MTMFDWQLDSFRSLNRYKSRLPHAILIRSRVGMGSAEFATSFAQSLLCETPAIDDKACTKCAACNWFGRGNHPDFRLVQPDSMSASEDEENQKKEKLSDQIRIEQIRALQDFLAVSTHRGGSKIVLIHPADTMNLNTQNALLKNLEEPPPETLFLLVTSHADRLLPTLRSRCVIFSLLPVNEKAAVQWLLNQGIEEAGIALAAAGGAPVAALDSAKNERTRTLFLEYLRDSTFDAIALADQSQSTTPVDIVTWLQHWSYDLLLARMTGGVRYNLRDQEAIVALSLKCDVEKIAAYWRHLARARNLVQHPLNPKLFVEDLLLQYRGSIIAS